MLLTSHDVTKPAHHWTIDHFSMATLITFYQHALFIVGIWQTTNILLSVITSGQASILRPAGFETIAMTGTTKHRHQKNVFYGPGVVIHLQECVRAHWPRADQFQIGQQRRLCYRLVSRPMALPQCWHSQQLNKPEDD